MSLLERHGDLLRATSRRGGRQAGAAPRHRELPPRLPGMLASHAPTTARRLVVLEARCRFCAAVDVALTQPEPPHTDFAGALAGTVKAAVIAELRAAQAGRQ